MRETKTETIGDMQFRVTQLGFRDARRVFARLVRTLGPAAARLAQDADSLSDLQGQGLLGAVEVVADRLTDEDLGWFAEALGGENARYYAGRDENGNQLWPKLDGKGRAAAFDGRLMLFFQWLVFALRVNYSDFLDVLSGPPAGAQSTKGPE